MKELWRNASAERLLVIMIAFMAVAWLGGKLAGTEATNGEYLALAGLLIALALVDHLHGIRQALEGQKKRPTV
jgi:hypothetical protein